MDASINTHLVWDLLCSNHAFKLESDAELTGVLSLVECGAISRAALKGLFLHHKRTMPYTFLEDGEMLENKTVKGLKAMAKGIRISGYSTMSKNVLILSLKPFEKTLTYMPAEAIGQVRRYRKHLKSVKRLEDLVGKKTVASLTWLQDSETPYYMMLRRDQISPDDTFEDRLLKDIYDDKNEHRMPKTHCMNAFCLSGPEMDGLPVRTYKTAPNPHSAIYPMKLYLLEPVLELAIKKFGSWEKFLDARVKKSDRREKKRLELQDRIAKRTKDLAAACAARGLSMKHEYMCRRDVHGFLNAKRGFETLNAHGIADTIVKQNAEKEARAQRVVSLRQVILPPRSMAGSPSVGTMLGKRPRSPAEATPSRGILTNQKQGPTSLEHLAKELNPDGVLIYTCECGYSSGLKKMLAHRSGAHRTANMRSGL
mmetsp:Transcript_6140/g.12021  ORF Transcript_6140/g.12021 Transcript_6140/m.12021 type:complete len:425 (+) Transcript_6140:158-1432(+)